MGDCDGSFFAQPRKLRVATSPSPLFGAIPPNSPTLFARLPNLVAIVRTTTNSQRVVFFFSSQTTGLLNRRVSVVGSPSTKTGADTIDAGESRLQLPSHCQLARPRPDRLSYLHETAGGDIRRHNSAPSGPRLTLFRDIKQRGAKRRIVPSDVSTLLAVSTLFWLSSSRPPTWCSFIPTY